MIKFALANNSARRLLLIKLLDIYNNSSIAEFQQTIDIYIDGSLNASKVTADDAVIMGSGWYIPTLDISYGCASTGWPSSTKAELIAIWTAVLAIPSNVVFMFGVYLLLRPCLSPLEGAHVSLEKFTRR